MKKITTWNATTDWIHFNWFQRYSAELAEKHRTNQKKLPSNGLREKHFQICAATFSTKRTVFGFFPNFLFFFFFCANSSFSDNQKPIEAERPVWEEYIRFGFAEK